MFSMMLWPSACWLKYLVFEFSHGKKNWSMLPTSKLFLHFILFIYSPSGAFGWVANSNIFDISETKFFSKPRLNFKQTKAIIWRDVYEFSSFTKLISACFISYAGKDWISGQWVKRTQRVCKICGRELPVI